MPFKPMNCPGLILDYFWITSYFCFYRMSDYNVLSPFLGNLSRNMHCIESELKYQRILLLFLLLSLTRKNVLLPVVRGPEKLKCVQR